MSQPPQSQQQTQREGLLARLLGRRRRAGVGGSVDGSPSRLIFLEVSPNPQIIDMIRTLTTVKNPLPPMSEQSLLAMFAESHNQVSQTAKMIMSSIFGDNYLAVMTPISNPDHLRDAVDIYSYVIQSNLAQIIEQRGDAIAREVANVGDVDEARRKASEIAEAISNSVKQAINALVASSTLIPLEILNLLSVNISMERDGANLARAAIFGFATGKSRQ